MECLSKKTKPEKWKLVDEPEFLHSGIFSVERHQVLNNENEIIRIPVVKANGDCVVIIPEYNDGLVLVNQHRYLPDVFTWEFPAGGTDGENHLVSAKKELLEETGLVSNNWTLLSKVRTGLALCPYYVYFYLAESCVLEEVADDSECIAWLMSYDEALQNICNDPLDNDILAWFLWEKHKNQV